ncbi:N-6 DNA Methylase [Streptomyces sp. ADI96-02]|nr:N-6 DNA Methylase [Streptomyces sp. ADI96-02]
MEPQNIEKIVNVFRERVDIPRFSRAVSLEEIADNDFNLNIRRYVDASPAAEPRSTYGRRCSAAYREVKSKWK